MSRTLEQIFVANPATTNISTDLMYFSRSPYTPNNDVGMLYSDFAAQFSNVLSAQGTANQVLVNGTSGTQETGNLIFTLPQDIALTSSPTFSNLKLTNGSLLDINGNTVLQLSALPAAVNHLAIVNNFAGFTPELYAEGADTDINMTYRAKGIGRHRFISSDSLSPFIFSTGTGHQHSTFFTFADTLANQQVTWQDASGTVAFLSNIPSGTPSALTKTDDTNVTLTLGGTPATALLQATSLTMGWTGQLSSARGGTGVNNGTSTITIGGNFAMVGAFTFSGTITAGTAVTYPTSGTLATTAQLPTPAALTKTDDTNVTIALGGTPATALLQATSLTMGWTGQLSLTRGGTNASLVASNGGLFYSTASAGAILAGTATANQIPLSGANAAPSWSTATYPATTTINQLLYSSAANAIGGVSTLNNGVLLTSATGVPTWLANSGTAGFILTANSGAPPSWQAVSASGGISTINGDSGSVTPSGGAVTIGGGSTGLTTSGTGSTLTLTGIANLAHGGTNANLTASNGGIFYSTATAGAILAGTATANQMLLSGASTTPAWSTATHPATTTINQLLYSSANNTIAGLATANSSVLSTSATGVPSFSQIVPASIIQTVPGGGAMFIYDIGSGGVGTPGFAVYWSGGSTINYLRTYGGGTGTGVNLDCASSGDANVSLTINGKGTGGVIVTGTGTNSAAGAGTVGEFISSVIPNASAVAFSNGVAKDLTSISLTAGDWDVYGNISFLGTTITSVGVWISTTSAVTPDRSLYNVIETNSGNQDGHNAPFFRALLSATTTVYITGSTTGTGSLSGAGGIYARRRR